MPAPVNEALTRFGSDPESVERLASRASAAAGGPGIHSVSVTARVTDSPGGRARRADVEQHFRAYDTPTRRDPLHTAR